MDKIMENIRPVPEMTVDAERLLDPIPNLKSLKVSGINPCSSGFFALLRIIGKVKDLTAFLSELSHPGALAHNVQGFIEVARDYPATLSLVINTIHIPIPIETVLTNPTDAVLNYALRAGVGCRFVGDTVIFTGKGHVVVHYRGISVRRE